MNRQGAYVGAYVFVSGGALALCGCYGLWAGWDIIQLERGWAQFIAGAVAVSGGVVTMALGCVIRALGQAAERIADAPVATQAPATPPLSQAPQAPAESDEASAPKARVPVSRAAARSPAPVEVDRYSMGEAEYVMFSDGSVELRSGGRAQRYPSIAALRADAAARRGS